MPSHLAVRISASTSNLGPGFDFLGLCLGLHLEAEAHAVDGGLAHRVEYESAPATWSEGDDLVLRTLAAYEKCVSVKLRPLCVRVRSEIPIGRGFGSSGAAVAATLLLASAHHSRADGAHPGEPDRDLLVDIALSIEGHPDNGTASLLGGCTLSVPHGGAVTVVRQPVHPSLGFALAWPATPLFTDEARAVLPSSIPFADAVENPRRLALLLEGLRSGAPRLLALGIEDRLHERHRRSLIPGSNEACQAARDAGAFAACLSGAGSGLVAIGPPEAMEGVAAALASPLEDGVGRAVQFEPDAPRVREIE